MNPLVECEKGHSKQSMILKSLDRLLDLLNSRNRNDFYTSMQALRDINILLEDFRPDSSTKNDLTVKNILKQLNQFLVIAGDFEMQMSLIELMVRLVRKSERPFYAKKWFPQHHLALKFLEIKESCFDEDCRKFLNILNESAGRERSVYSYVAAEAHLGYHKLTVPKGNEFWVDFNSVSKCLTIYVDDENNNSNAWETITIADNDVNNYTIKERGRRFNMLHLNLTLLVSDLFEKCQDNSQVVQIMFDKSINLKHALNVAFGNKSCRRSISGGKSSVTEMDISVNRTTKSSKDILSVIPVSPELISSSLPQDEPYPKIGRGNSDVRRVSVPLIAMVSPARETVPKSTFKTSKPTPNASIMATKSKNTGHKKHDNSNDKKDVPKTPKTKQGSTKRVKTPLRIIIPNDKSSTDNEKSNDTDTDMKKPVKERIEICEQIDIKREVQTAPNGEQVGHEVELNIADLVVADLVVADLDIADLKITDLVIADLGDGHGIQNNEAENDSDAEDLPIVSSGRIVPVENDSDVIPDSLPPSYDSQLSKVDNSELYTKKVYLAALTPTLSTVAEEEASRSKQTTPSNKPESPSGSHTKNLTQSNVPSQNSDINQVSDEDHLNVSQESVCSQSSNVLLKCSQTRAKPKYNPSLGGWQIKTQKPSRGKVRASQPKENIDEVILENESDPYEFQVETRARKRESDSQSSSPPSFYAKYRNRQKESTKQKVKKTKKQQKGKIGKKNDEKNELNKRKTEDKIDHYSFEKTDEECGAQKQVNRRGYDDTDTEPIPYDDFIKMKAKQNLEKTISEEECQEDSLSDFKKQSCKKSQTKGKGRKRKFLQSINPVKQINSLNKILEKENRGLERKNKRNKIVEIEVLSDGNTDEMEVHHLEECNEMDNSYRRNKKQRKKNMHEIEVLSDGHTDEVHHLEECNEMNNSNRRNKKQRKKNMHEIEVLSDGHTDEVHHLEERNEMNNSNRRNKKQRKKNMHEIEVLSDGHTDEVHHLEERNEMNNSNRGNKKQRKKNMHEIEVLSDGHTDEVHHLEERNEMNNNNRGNKKQRKKNMHEIEVHDEQQKNMGEIEVMRDAHTDDIEFQDRDLNELHTMVGSMIRGCKPKQQGAKSKQMHTVADYNQMHTVADYNQMHTVADYNQMHTVADYNKKKKLERKKKEQQEINNYQLDENYTKRQERRKPGSDDSNARIEDFETPQEVVSCEEDEEIDKEKSENGSLKLQEQEVKMSKMENLIETIEIIDTDDEEEKEDLSYRNEEEDVFDEEASVTSFATMCKVLMTDVKKSRRSRRPVNYEERGSSLEDSSTSAGSPTKKVCNKVALRPQLNTHSHMDIGTVGKKKGKVTKDNDDASSITSRRSWLVEKEKKQVSTYSKGRTNVWVKQKGRTSWSPLEPHSNKKNGTERSPLEPDSNKKENDAERKSKKGKTKRKLSSLGNMYMEPKEVEKSEDGKKRKRVEEEAEDDLMDEKLKSIQHVIDELEQIDIEEDIHKKCIETTPAQVKDKYHDTHKVTRTPCKLSSQQSVSTAQDYMYFQTCEELTSTTSTPYFDKEHSVELLNFHFDFDQEMGTQKEDDEEEQRMTTIPAIIQVVPSSNKTPALRDKSNIKIVQPQTVVSGPSKDPRPTKSALKRKYQVEIEYDEEDLEEKSEDDTVDYEVQKERKPTRNSARGSSLLMPKKLFDFEEQEADQSYYFNDGEQVGKSDDGQFNAGKASTSCFTGDEEIEQIEHLLQVVRGTINKHIQTKQSQTKKLAGCAINTVTKHLKSFRSYHQASFKELKLGQQKILGEILSLEEGLEAMNAIELKSSKLMKQLHGKLSLKLYENIETIRNTLEEFQERNVQLDISLKRELQSGLQNIIFQEINELKNKIIQDEKRQELMQVKRSLQSLFTTL
ncbi:uncharacterized protein [Antedon mediterranea]|uniref:uncharacterized protein n=1 Tax=Antedon mediterranea TaxID=105859 RepID=UPI003AF4B437